MNNSLEMETLSALLSLGLRIIFTTTRTTTTIIICIHLRELLYTVMLPQ